MKPNPSSSNTQATPNTSSTTGLTPEITETIKKLALSVQEEAAAPKTSPEKAQDIKDPAITDAVSQAQPVKSTKRTVTIPSARGAMRVLGLNGNNTVSVQREGSRTATVRQASRKESTRPETSKPSSKSTPAREESRKSSRKESLTDSRRTKSRTDRVGSRNDELQSYYIDAKLKDGTKITLKIKSATPVTKDSKRVKRALEEANHEIDMRRAEIERADAEMAMRLHEEENFSPYQSYSSYNSPYSTPIRPQYNYYSPSHAHQSFQHEGVNYSGLKRSYRNGYQDDASRSLAASRSESKSSLDAQIKELDKSIRQKEKDIAAFDAAYRDHDTKNASNVALKHEVIEKPKKEIPALIKPFNLIGHGEYKLVDYNQIKAGFLSSGIHKSISTQDSNCWMRSTWISLLSQLDPNTFADKITASLGQDYTLTAEYLARLITPLKYDTHSIFTTLSRASNLIDSPSNLKYTHESSADRETFAEDDIFKLTAAILNKQGIDDYKIEDAVLGDGFGGEELMQALANELDVKFIMLSDYLKEVTIYAPKDSELAQKLNEELEKKPSESLQESLTSIIKSHFEDTPVVLHMDLFKAPNTETPAPQDAKHEDDYMFMTGNHFEVILPGAMGHNLLD